MKNLFLAAPLGLAMIIAAAPASAADSGTIFFAGEIRTGTCPIEVVDPVSGGTGVTIPLGIANTANFGAINVESNERRFALRVPGTCVTTAGDATVKFESTAGSAGTANDLYALRPSAGSATNLALVIKDARTKTRLAHGADSAPFPLVLNTGADMNFLAAYISTAAAVTQGSVNADVNFTVTLP